MQALLIVLALGEAFVITEQHDCCAVAFVVTETHATSSVAPVFVDSPKLNRLIDSTGDAAPTPMAEVVRVLALLPKPEVGFVEFGTGSDARWACAAAVRWGCKCYGIEIDPERAAQARASVREAGMGAYVTIITGDALTTDVNADVGVAFLYPETLSRLKPRLVGLRAFASYIHQPPVSAVRNGDSWIYLRPESVQVATTAVWNGQAYTGPLCNSPNCGMCASIRAQLAAAPKPAVVFGTTPAAGAAKPGYHYETRKFCNGRQCWYQNVEVPN